MSSMPDKIAVFIPSLRGGGAERAMILFANELARRGTVVDLLLLQKSGQLQDLVDARVHIIDLNASRAIKSIFSVVKYLKEEQPKALYASIINVNLIAIIAGKLARTKTKIIIRESNMPTHAFSGTRSGRVSLKLLPYIYPMADSVIAVCNAVAKELCDASPKLRDKVHVLPTPVVSKDLVSLSKQDLSLPELYENNFILSIGRLHSQKDFPTLLHAFKELHKENYKLKLVILGEGPERLKLEQLSHKLNIHNNVLMPGFITNPFPFIAQCSVFVLPSKFEGMPNVLIQAIGLGKPCVATDCPGGSRDASYNGKYARLVPVGNVQALHQALQISLDSSIGNEGSQFIMNNYAVTPASTRYLSLSEAA